MLGFNRVALAAHDSDPDDGGIVLDNLGFSNALRTLQEMVEPAHTRPVRGDDIVLHTAFDRTDQTKWAAALTFTFRTLYRITCTVSNERHGVVSKPRSDGSTLRICL